MSKWLKCNINLYNVTFFLVEDAQLRHNVTICFSIPFSRCCLNGLIMDILEDTGKLYRSSSSHSEQMVFHAGEKKGKIKEFIDPDA